MKRSMDARVISAFTRVFDALLPAHDESRTNAAGRVEFGVALRHRCRNRAGSASLLRWRK
jgi:hypothetical protein